MNTMRVDDSWLREARERGRAAAARGGGDAGGAWRARWALKPISRQVVDRVQAYCRASPPNDDFEETPRHRCLRVSAGGKRYEFATEEAISGFLRRQPASLTEGETIEDVAAPAFGDPMPLSEYYATVAYVHEKRTAPVATGAVDAKATKVGGVGGQEAAALADSKKRFENTVIDAYTRKGEPEGLRIEVVTRGVCLGYALSAAFENEYELAVVADSLEVCLRGVGLLNKIIFSTPFLLGRAAELAIVRDYLALARAGPAPGPGTNGAPPPPLELEELQKNAKQLMLGPKAITLEQRHVAPPNSIFDGAYAMCEKTDGERALLFVDAQGHAHLIGAGLRPRATGITYRDEAAKLSLIDGEHVASLHDGAMLFMIFDVYFVGGKDVRSKHLAERLEHAAAFRAEGVGLRVATKTFYGLERDTGGPDATAAAMKEACAEVLAKAHDTITLAQEASGVGSRPGGFPYHTDGIIFTPMHEPVSGLKNAVLKWKPPDQSTIDVLVDSGGASTFQGADGKTYAQFTLYTGFNEANGDFGKIFDVLTKLYTDHRQAGNRDTDVKFYGKRPFQPTAFYANHVHKAMVPVVHGVPVCEDGTPVRDNTIVEFAYTVDDTKIASYNWRPLRVRADKTQEYANSGRIGGAANDYRTALSVWKSIHMPVTEAMLRGEATVDPDLTNYYEDVGDRRESANFNLLDFHNRVKAALYTETVALLPAARRSQPTLAELACGKGGDLLKWLNSGFSVIFGVDNNRDGIMNGINGAYRRLMNAKGSKWNPARATVVFAVADCGSRFTSDGAGLDPESIMLMNVVMGRKGAGASPYLAKLHNKGNGNGGFDVVSSQFAVHYMFTAVDRARAFMQNVAQLLRPGGLFIGTCMDGERVDAMLAENPTARGTAGQHPHMTTIWELTKGYETFAPYGSTIHVFLERTGHTIPEPLVDFRTLVKLASDYNLSLVNTYFFEERYDAHAGELKSPMTADEQRFSFLNRAFTFQKTGATVTSGAAAAQAVDKKEEEERLRAEEEAKKQLEEDSKREAGPVRTILVDAKAARTSFAGTGGGDGDGSGDGGLGEGGHLEALPGESMTTE